MKWILIDKYHINTDCVETFHWIEGRLYVNFDRSTIAASLVIKDPEQETYRKLCAQLGVRPVEDDTCGKE